MISFFPQIPINLVELEQKLSDEIRSDNSSHLNVDLTKKFLTIVDKNECLDQSLHDCSPNAKCFNTEGSFTCKCKTNFVDQGEPEFPGRTCVEDWAERRPKIRDPELDVWVVIAFCVLAFLALPVSFCIWKKKSNRNKVVDIKHERMSPESNYESQEPHGNELSS